jgi:hypothetical protein
MQAIVSFLPPPFFSKISTPKYLNPAFKHLLIVRRSFLFYHPLFRPYNARLTREAVAPIWPAWKGRADGGSGATFADETNPFD